MATAPRIVSLEPAAALPGGEIRLRGEALFSHSIPEVRIGGMSAFVIMSAARAVAARVPDGALSGPVEVQTDGATPATSPRPLEVGIQIAENVQPVCNPALDSDGNILVTLSGSRGQKTPVSLFKVDANFTLRPWSSAIINPSGIAVDRDGGVFVSSRHEGSVYRVAANGAATLFAEGLGIATGIAFDAAGDLYVGDRSGTIFKIDRERNTFVFATIEPSVAAYHLAFGPDQHLYVTGPTTSSHDTIWRISPRGAVAAYFHGLGRPQGMAFEADGSLLAVASYRGHRGVVRIRPSGEAACCLSANNLVGLAFASAAQGFGEAASSLILATQNALFHLPWPYPGLALPPI